MTRSRYILPDLMLLLAKEMSSQVMRPDFNLIRGTNDFSLGKLHGIGQDRFGKMWFTDQTNNCLICYDGYPMSILRNDPRNGDSQSSNTEALQLYFELRSLRFLRKIDE